LREAREEPGKLVKFTSSQGRPLYGALLETTFGVTEDVSNLCWMRLTTVILLTILGIALWRQFYQSGWTEIEAAVIGLGITLLPAAQVAAGWAIGWPYVLTLLLALAGFSAIETEVERGGLKRVIALVGGCLIYVLAGLIYQSDAMFAVVPITAVLLVRTGREPMTDTRWVSIHLATLLIGMLVGFLLVKLLFSSGVFVESARLKFEANPFTKLGWFLWNPVPNALALFVLRDDFHTGEVFFWLAVLAVGGFIAYSYRRDRARNDAVRNRRWLVALAVMPWVAHAVSLAAAERSAGYRTLFALSGLVLVLVVFGLRTLREAGVIRMKRPWKYYSGLGVAALAAAVAAGHNAFALLAEPQGAEWEIVRNAALRVDFKADTRIYLITPTLADRSTGRVFRDEFGSLSSDSDWTPREMFRAAVRQRYADKMPKNIGYTVTLGRAAPADEKAYDMVIDLRKIAQRRTQ
jgi:hypothetical protein